MGESLELSIKPLQQLTTPRLENNRILKLLMVLVLVLVLMLVVDAGVGVGIW